MKKIIIYILIGCLSNCQFIDFSVIKAVKKSASNKAKIGIGNIESRLMEQTTSLPTENLRDFLEFHYLKKKFDVMELGNLKPKNDNHKFHALDNSSVLHRKVLPKKYQKSAGEIEAFKRENNSISEFRPEVIRKICKKYKLDYFAYGAIAKSSSENLLDEENHIMIFLKFYNKKGVKKGMVVYYLEDQLTIKPSVLNKAAKNMVNEFVETIYE